MILHQVVAGTGNGNAFAWSGGAGFIAVTGTFGGTTISLEHEARAGGPWVPLASKINETGVPQLFAIAAARCVRFKAPPGRVRTVATGGSGISLSVYVSQPEVLGQTPQSIPQTTTTTTTTTSA